MNLIYFNLENLDPSIKTNIYKALETENTKIKKKKVVKNFQDAYENIITKDKFRLFTEINDIAIKPENLAKAATCEK